MKLEQIEPEYREVFKTHYFDFNNPICHQSGFIDYQCKNCDCMLVATVDNSYYISNSIRTDFNAKYQRLTCNNVIMENVLK